jgi:hypothetical protein
MGVGPRLCSILDMDFYEKALFVKPTWRLYIVVGCNGFLPFARYASIRTLWVSSHSFGSSVHRMRSVFSS